MALSDLIQGSIRQAVTLLATPGLQYRTGPTGSWTALVGIFHADGTQIVGYDDAHNSIVAPSTAHLKIPDNGTVLQIMPAGQEWQVRTADLTQWAVVGVSRHVGQSIYHLRRSVTTSIGHQRGDVA